MADWSKLVRNATSAVGVTVLGREMANALPVIEEEVVVTVFGSPQNRTRLSDLYQVAASAAFGAIRNRTVTGLLPPAGAIIVEFDYAESFVRFTILYRTSLSNAAINSLLTTGGVKSTFQTLPVFGNLRDSLTGGEFNFASQLPNVGQTPALKYTGRTILTRSPNMTFLGAGVRPAPNPAPPVDGKSRASLVNIVTAALSSPGTVAGMLFPSPTGQAPPSAAVGGSQ